MSPIVALAAVLSSTSAALQIQCGAPDFRHPPALVTNYWDKIIGLRQGITGGQEAEPNSYPWIAMIYSGAYGNICGASLISDEWLVTAARCLHANLGTGRQVMAGEVRAYLGAHKKWHGQEIQISQVKIHPKYRVDRADGYDVALLKLSVPVSNSDKIQPICLPHTKDNYKVDGINMVVAGWGRDETNSNSKSVRHALLATDMGRCYAVYWSQAVAPKETDMCARRAGKGGQARRGDYGGPLMALKANKFVLAGIVSRGNEGGDAPGIFTHVPGVRSWIFMHARV